MKKVLIVAAVILCATTAFAGPQFIAGGGATLNMYNTDNTFEVDAVPTMSFGIGTEAGDVFGGLTPDEVFVIGTYSRGKTGDTTLAGVTLNEYVSTYSGSIAGIWYLADSTQKAQPFFVLRTNVENERSSTGSLYYWNGQFGLGVGYPLSERSDVWAAATVKMGAIISTDLAVGLKFGF